MHTLHLVQTRGILISFNHLFQCGQGPWRGLKAGAPTCAGAKPMANAKVPCAWQDRASWGAELCKRRRWPGGDGAEV